MNRYVLEMGEEISDLERRLETLREAWQIQTRGQTGVRPKPARRGRQVRPGDPPTPPIIGDPPIPPPPPPTTAPSAKKGVKLPKRVTHEVAASRKLQGRYLALIRQVPVEKRKRFSKTAKEKGREAAIKEMCRTLKK